MRGHLEGTIEDEDELSGRLILIVTRDEAACAAHLSFEAVKIDDEPNP